MGLGGKRTCGRRHGHLQRPVGQLGLRLDGSVLLYGSETLRIPVAGTAGRLNREITTENWVAQVGLGPQIVLPLRGARPYFHGFAGLSYLSTESHLSDPAGFAGPTSTNYDDTGFAYGGGGGVVVPLRDHGPSIDLGVRYVRTSSVRFLAEGDLSLDGGTVRPVPHRGQANVVEFRLGVVLRLPSTRPARAPAPVRPAGGSAPARRAVLVLELVEPPVEAALGQQP
jgi:hypothetical protein